jgi:N-acetylglutamate synthase-like GNAT family acetyltransferase
MVEELMNSAATEDDLSGIISVLLANRDASSLLQRSEHEVRQYLSDFMVVKNEQGHILGCAALHKYSRASAEVFSVAVLPQAQGKGVGKLLMRECLRRAKVRGIKRVWLTTQESGYFAQFGYKSISLWQLPISVLFAKLGQVFRRPPNGWLSVLPHRQTLMQLELKRDP